MKQFLIALRLFLVLSLLTGLIYPLVVTGVALATFPHQANGSLVVQNGRVVGSSLIGQEFQDPKYFWGRVSATSPVPYNAAASGGSNLGPTNPALIGGKDKDGKPIAGSIQDRVDSLHTADPDAKGPVPVDLATSSASGLDPNISPEAAIYQAARVAKANQLPLEYVLALIKSHTSGRQFGVLGEPVVNVLELNLEIVKLAKK